MDGKPDKGHADTVGQPGSQPASGAGKPIGAIVGIPGTIDPEIARTTSGTAKVNGNHADTGNGEAAGNPIGTGNTTGTTEQVKRGRGRPPGSSKPKPDSDKDNTSPRSVKTAKLEINGVEKILFSVHTIFAAISGVPEFQITEKEASELSSAIALVSEHYAISLDPKTAAWLELSRVCGIIYGPRAVSLWLQVQAKPKTVTVKDTNIPLNAAQEPPAVFNFDPTKISVH